MRFKLACCSFLTTCAALVAQVPARPDISPDARVRAAYFLPDAKLKPVTDPVFLKLFGEGKREPVFQASIVGMDGNVAWIKSPRLAEAIPIDVTQPQRWPRAMGTVFRNNLGLSGEHTRDSSPEMFGRTGNYAGANLWRILDEFQVSDFLLDGSWSANGYVEIVKRALDKQLNPYRREGRTENHQIESVRRVFLMTYFRIVRFILTQEGQREEYVFLCPRNGEGILAILGQRPSGIVNAEARHTLAEQIRKDYGIGANGGWSNRHGAMFGEGASEGGIWLPEEEPADTVGTGGGESMRKFWFSPALKTYCMNIRVDIVSRWFEDQRKLIGVGTNSEVLDAWIRRVKTKIAQNPSEAEADLKVLYCLAGDDKDRLAEVQNLEEPIIAAQGKRDAAEAAARKLTEERAAIESKEKPKRDTRRILCTMYRSLEMLQKSVAHERKVQAETGIVNKTKLYNLGNSIVQAKEYIATYRRDFRKLYGREFNMARDCADADRDDEARAATKARPTKTPAEPAPSTDPTLKAKTPQETPIPKESPKRTPVIVPPRVKHQPPPPKLKAASGAFASYDPIYVDMVVGEDGVPTIARSRSGDAWAEQYAMEWRFEPATIDGKPQPSRFTITVKLTPAASAEGAQR